MLQKLHIQNYAIIDEIDIAFSNRLNIITGETGAGKSILMGALSLILGERADTSVLMKTDKKCFNWAKEAVDRGAGEILLTSMNHDGTKNGFAIEITKLLSETLPVPIIASGGAGNMEHFVEVFEKASADAALAASIFHFKEIPIPDLKQFLHRQNIAVRL